MRSLLLTLAAAACVVALTRTAAADSPVRHERPDPAKWFDVLDKDHDGQLALDELPPLLKSHRELLKQADKNQDRKFSKEEFVKALGQMKEAALRHWREGHRGPPAAEHAKRAKPRGDKQAHARRPDGKRPEGRGDRDDRRCPCPGCREHARQFRPYGRPESSAGHREGYASPHGPRPHMPPQALHGVFTRMDRNRDGVLSFEEFARGMAFVHQRMTAGKHPQRPFHPSWHAPKGPDRPLPPGHPSVKRFSPPAPHDGDRHHHRGGPEVRRPHGPPPQCGPGCPGCPHFKPSSRGGEGNPPPHHEKKEHEKKEAGKKDAGKKAEK